MVNHWHREEKMAKTKKKKPNSKDIKNKTKKEIPAKGDTTDKAN